MCSWFVCCTHVYTSSSAFSFTSSFSTSSYPLLSCPLSLLNPYQEMGGYFIVNGNERLIRMLIMPRRNYVSLSHLTCPSDTCSHFFLFLSSCTFLSQPLAIARPSWKNRGALYTEYGIQIRCVRKDQTGSVCTVALSVMYWVCLCDVCTLLTCIHVRMADDDIQRRAVWEFSVRTVSALRPVLLLICVYSMCHKEE